MQRVFPEYNSITHSQVKKSMTDYFNAEAYLTLAQFETFLTVIPFNEKGGFSS